MNLIDILLILFYLLVLIVIGLWQAKKERNLEDYFLAGRSMNWFMVMVSIYATSASALTFIGVPGAAFKGDYNYLTLGIGSLLGRVFIAMVFLKLYYHHQVTSIYQFLLKRFGQSSQLTGAFYFIVTRLLASGVRLAGVAIAITVVFEFPFAWALVVVAFVAIMYTMLGGMKAIIYTDFLQFVIFIGGAILVLFIIWNLLPGGFSQFYDIASSHNKFAVFDWHFSLNNSKSILAGTIFGGVVTMAALGCDQDLVQRMLTCRSLKESRRALILTGFMDIPIVILFLTIGSSLFVYYQVYPDVHLPLKADYVFPYFIKTIVPTGVKGLLIAGLLAAAMSSLDSALNALSSSVVVDIIVPFSKKELTQKQKLKLARVLVIAFGVILSLIAILFSNTESILWLGFKIVGYTYGGLLGLFLLGSLTRNRGRDKTLPVIVTASVILSIVITSLVLDEQLIFLWPWQSHSSLKPLLSWPWGVIVAASFTFVLGASQKEKTVIAN